MPPLGLCRLERWADGHPSYQRRRHYCRVAAAAARCIFLGGPPIRAGMGRLAREKAARRAARKGAASGGNKGGKGGSTTADREERRLTRADYAALAIAPPGYEGTPPPPGAGGICGKCDRPLYAYETTITDQATGLLCCMPCLGLRPGDPCPCGCGDPVVCPDIPPPQPPQPQPQPPAPSAAGAASAAAAAPDAGGPGAGLLMQLGFMEWMAERMVRPSDRIDMAERRARRHIEDQKASAPCECCGTVMPAAGRCDECHATGVWYCATCHDRLEDMARRKVNAYAENQKESAPCDGCGHAMLAADRCEDCRANGLWICVACHARLICMAGQRAANAAEPTEIIRKWGNARI